MNHPQEARFRELLRTDKRFNAFIQQRYAHPLMKKKSIPGCILSVTQRVTKYPLMMDVLIKYSKDQPEELDTLKEALANIKVCTVSCLV